MPKYMPLPQAERHICGDQVYVRGRHDSPKKSKQLRKVLLYRRWGNRAKMDVQFKSGIYEAKQNAIVLLTRCIAVFYMDKFVTKKTPPPRKRAHGKECAGPSDSGSSEKALIKKNNNKGPDSLQEQHFVWKRIRAVNLNCDYTSIFTKIEADEIFQQLEQEIEYFSGDLSKVHVFGKWHTVPRKQVTYGNEGLTYAFSGIKLSPKPWIPVLDRIRERVKLATGHSFNFVLINRYKDGNDHIGDHRDDERELVSQSPIASVSFGACRDFVFRHRDSRSKNSICQIQPVKLELEHGSLLMMNFPTNVYWYHSLPVRKRVIAPRVNLTFRQLMSQSQK